MDKQKIVVIDADGLVVGRLATHVARAALHGQQIAIVNCEKSVISGQRHTTIDEWKHRFSMGVPRKGPYHHRFPDRLVRRIIRGMLPYKVARGRAAFERVMCYIGVPTQFKEMKAITFADAQASKLPNARSMTMGDLCKEMGGKWHE